MLNKYDLTLFDDPVEEVFYSESFTAITPKEIVDQDRWRTSYEQVFKDINGVFWIATWSRGSTEYQDEGIEDLELVEVEPREVTKVEYFVVEH